MFVSRRYLGVDFHQEFLEEDNMVTAISKDEFQMCRTTLNVGDSFTVLGVGEFSVCKIWVATPFQPIELPAVGLMDEMQVEIIFERVKPPKN